MGAVDSWLREHAVLHTTTGAYDPNANSLIEESVGARKRGIRCLLHQAHAPVSLWPDETCCREKPSSWPPWGCLAFAIKLDHPTVRRGSLEPFALQGIFVVGTGECHTASKLLRPSAMTVRLKKCSRLCERVTQLSLCSVGAGMKPATETELQEFGESVWVRPDEVEEPSLALRRPADENEEKEGNLAHGKEMQGSTWSC